MNEYQHLTARYHEAEGLIRRELTVVQLKSVLKSLGLALSGLKATLIDRLMHYLSTGYKNQDTQRIHQVHLLIENARGELPSLRPVYNNYQNNDLPHLRTGSGYPSPYQQQQQQQQQQLGSSYLHGNPNSNRQPVTSHLSHVSNSTHSRLGSAPLTHIVFVGSPFYDLQRALLAPFLCPKSSDNRNGTTVQFTLTADELTKVASKLFGVYLLACPYDNLTSSRRSQIGFPPTTEAHLNSKPVQANFRGIKNKPGTTKPANLSPYLNMNGEINRLHISFGHVKQEYAFSICLVKLHTIDSLVERVRANPHIEANTTKELIKQLEGDDEDLVSCGTNLSLKCPLSYARLQVPIRSICCRHVSCFDAASYIMLQEQHPTWLCPLCNKTIKFADLSVDDYLIEILSKTKDDDETIEIQPDGTWVVREESSDMESSPEPESMRRNTGGNPTMKREKFDDGSDIEIVDLDDDEVSDMVAAENNVAPASEFVGNTPASIDEVAIANNNDNNNVNNSKEMVPADVSMMNDSVENIANIGVITNTSPAFNNTGEANGTNGLFGSNTTMQQDQNTSNTNLGNGQIYNHNSDTVISNDTSDPANNFSLDPLTFSSPANTIVNLGTGVAPVQLPLPYSAPIDSFLPSADKTIVTTPTPVDAQREITLPSWDQSTLFGRRPSVPAVQMGNRVNGSNDGTIDNIMNGIVPDLTNGILDANGTTDSNGSVNNNDNNDNNNPITTQPFDINGLSGLINGGDNRLNQLNQHSAELNAINQQLDENLNKQEEVFTSLAKVREAKARTIGSMTASSGQNGSFDPNSVSQMPSWTQSSLARLNCNNPRLSSAGAPRGPRPEFQNSNFNAYSTDNSVFGYNQNHNQPIPNPPIRLSNGMSNQSPPIPPAHNSNQNQNQNQNQSFGEGYFPNFQPQQGSPVNQNIKSVIKSVVQQPQSQTSTLNQATMPTHKRPVEDVIDLTLSDDEEPPNKR